MIATIKIQRQFVCLAALMLLPGSAWACGGFEWLSGGVGEAFNSFAEAVHLVHLVIATIVVAVAIFIASPMVMALEWGAATAWKARIKTAPPFGFWSVFALFLAVFLVIAALVYIPAFDKLFASFGADLPMPTRLLLSGRYLLVLPLVIAGGLVYRWRFNSRQERYSSYLLAGEALLLVLVQWALYLPIFRMC